jgi:hypothetical protein
MANPDQPAGRIAVRWLPIEALTPNPRNARIRSARQVARIADSIAALGFNVPILVDGRGGVLAGHGRLLAARRLGLNEVPTLTLDHLNEAQRRAFMIADNRLGDYVAEPTTYPSGRHDDQVGSTAQALAWAKRRLTRAEAWIEFWRP